MPWIPLDDSDRYSQRLMKEVEGPARFMLDNNVDFETILRFLDGRGISAEPLPLRLAKRSDYEVLEEAWKQDRILLTHDDDFLNEELHPPESNPGVVIMPGGSGNVADHLGNIGSMLDMMRTHRALWRQVYVKIYDSGAISICGVNSTTGERIDQWWLRFIDGRPHQWIAEFEPPESIPE